MIDLEQADAFTARWSAVEPGLRRALAGRLAHACDRDDALQEAALLAWQLRDRFDATLPFGPWAWGLARNSLRRLCFQRAMPMPTPTATREEPVDPLLERLEIALGRLAPEERAILLQIHGEGRTQAEIAAGSGRSVRQVSARLHRAERRLRRLLSAL